MSSDGEGEQIHTHSSVERLKSLGVKRSFNEDGESSKVDYPAVKRSNLEPGVSLVYSSREEYVVCFSTSLN